MPNTNLYKAFGANGTIIGDTIFYFGGASTASNFPAQDRLRKGVIDPQNPRASRGCLRSPAGSARATARLCGGGRRSALGRGSSTSYNYDALAYNGGGVVEPANAMLHWNGSALVNAGTTEPRVMDLRGAGELGDNSFIIAGGIGTARTVLDSVWLVTATGVSVDEVMEQELRVAPTRPTEAVSSTFHRSEERTLCGP
ncbi:MAG: hypothetical protein IPN62_17690 [Flavobacteriales bacterium]|nr:hypothetical protein [Flavobacteriales bacterium]